jgi:exodeoxyribonuclease VII large subunit
MSDGFDLFTRRERRVYKVRELTRELKGLVEGKFPALQVEGEVSNLRRNATSGHWYFTLKDDGAALRCALFKNQARLVTFALADGQQILAKGRLSIYEAAGEYSLVCDSVEPLGAGALALKFEELKKRLAAEGLFDPAQKRPLPFIPRRIGVVTSPTGAAIQDFLRVLHRRWPGMPVLVASARVQGEGAAAEICEGIRRLSAVDDVDVIVVTRGGGSIEDLWAFNEEAVARAIRRSPVPVVSAVGHETDVTISDFAADLRAPTPTAAAELVVRVRAELAEQLAVTRGRLERALSRQLEQRRGRMATLRRSLSDPRRVIGERRIVVDRLLSRAERPLREQIRTGRQELVRAEQALRRLHPSARLASLREALVRLEQRAIRATHAQVGREQGRLGTLAGRLDGMSPLKVLSRGYSLAYGPTGHLVLDAAALSPGDSVRVRLARGAFTASVDRVEDDAGAPFDAAAERG